VVTLVSDSRGQKPTKYYKDNPEACKLRQARNNPAREIANRIAGGRAIFRALSKDERFAIMETAYHMHDLGVDFITAKINESHDRRGFVYVITHEAFPNYVKIGRAFDPTSRLRSYQTGCPHRGYRLFAAIYFEDCYMAEKEIHARLEDEYRNGALGEWFNITPFLARHNINKLRSIL